jgi:hypothetical protein
MKSIFTILAVLSISPAFAVSYECTHVEGQKLKIFQEKPDHAVAVLQTGLTNQIYKGTFAYEDEALYEITKYELTNSIGQPAPITLSKRVVMGRGGCGRGGCNHYPSLTSKASLTVNGLNKIFNCL